MQSAAYLDLSVRLREAILLIRQARASVRPDFASACSKAASVLLAAALERYVNDALDHACRAIQGETWAELPAGVQNFLVAQIARRLREASETIARPTDVDTSRERRLRTAVTESNAAFDRPSEWRHLPQLGMFMEGAAAPDRINAVLLNFRTDGKSILKRVEERGLDRGVFARGISDLIDTRHAAAHAIPDRSPPSPNDVATWAAITFWLVRQIEIYLREAIQ